MPTVFRSGRLYREYASFPLQDHPAGAMEDFVTGFLDRDGRATGRPVGVAVDKSGALLIADDVGNTVWRVAPRRFETADL